MMKKSQSITAFALFSFLSLFGAILYAQDRLPPPRTEGKVLILDNNNVLEGDIVRDGSVYRVRRAVGELSLPAARVKFLGQDHQEVLGFMRSRINLRDADERLRLSRWCHLNCLYDEAVEEAREALNLVPTDKRIQEYMHMLERVAKAANRPKAATKKEVVTLSENLPSIDLNADSLAFFTTKIQPILMNTCASCHAGDYQGPFHLQRNFGNGVGNRRTTLNNLSTVVNHFDLDRPNLSPLLIKAVSAHGNGTNAPINGRRSTPYLLLQRWVERTIATNPHLKEIGILARENQGSSGVQQTGFASGTKQGTEKAVAKAEKTNPAPGEMVTRTGFGTDSPSVGGGKTPAGKTIIRGGAPTPQRPEVPGAVRPPETPAPGADEYDPGPFNQQVSPGNRRP